MNKKNFKVGDEVFHTGHTLERGTIIAIKEYGYDVKTKHGQQFFSDISTYTKEEAYAECDSNVDYWQREANKLLAELEAEDEQDEELDNEQHEMEQAH